MCSRFLLDSGNFLHSQGDYRDTNEFKHLSEVVASNVEGIIRSLHADSDTERACDESKLSTSTKMIRGILQLWPLYIASIGPALPLVERGKIVDMLYSLGAQACLPKAFALVRKPLGEQWKSKADTIRT